MKRIFALLFLTVSLIACETEPLDPSLNNSNTTGGGSGGGNSASIVGSWDYEAYVVDTSASVTVNGNTVNTVNTSTLLSSNAVITFEANGDYQITGDVTYEITSPSVPAMTQTSDVSDSGTYNLTGNALVLTSDNASSNPNDARLSDIDLTITSLTTTELIMDLDLDTVENIGGFSTSIVIDGTAEFSR